MSKTPPPAKRDALGFTADERYWLGKLVSETGEFGQVAGNAQCFGLDTPDHGGTARERIADELGDVLAALRLAVRARLIPRERVVARAEAKERKLLDPNQRDNLGRRLAPPMPDEADAEAIDIPAAPPHVPDPVEFRAADGEPLALSAEVSARIMVLSKAGRISPDRILRRALKIEAPATIPQDGSVGFRDEATGFVLPEGFPIERTFEKKTYRAVATAGGFRDEAGAHYPNLNRLNRSLPITRPENAWNEWWFVDADGRARRLNTARPLPSPRNVARGRKLSILRPSDTP